MEELEPYPGAFLRDNLNEKIMNTSISLFQEYMEQGAGEDGIEATRNIKIASEYENSLKDPAMDFVFLQRKWKKLMNWLADERHNLKKALPEQLHTVTSGI